MPEVDSVVEENTIRPSEADAPPERRRRGAYYYSRAVRAGLIRGQQQQFPPRTQPPRDRPRFLIPRGTPCGVNRISDMDWQTFTITRDCGFERFERYERQGERGYYEFRSVPGAWLLLVDRQFVKHRKN
jgi:hypothetical protein